MDTVSYDARRHYITKIDFKDYPKEVGTNF
jgi:hypothetical protein